MGSSGVTEEKEPLLSERSERFSERMREWDWGLNACLSAGQVFFGSDWERKGAGGESHSETRKKKQEKSNKKKETGKIPNISINRIDKVCLTHKMKYYTAIEKNKLITTCNDR